MLGAGSWRAEGPAGAKPREARISAGRTSMGRADTSSRVRQQGKGSCEAPWASYPGADDGAPTPRPQPATPSGVIWLSSSDPGSALGTAVFDTFPSYLHLETGQNLLEGEGVGIKSVGLSVKS